MDWRDLRFDETDQVPVSKTDLIAITGITVFFGILFITAIIIVL